MPANTPEQYRTQDNLRARQRLWEQQRAPVDVVGWVLNLASPDLRSDAVVLDAGCGNGMYLAQLRRRPEVTAIGCDLSLGMLRAAEHPLVANADVHALPFRRDAFDVALAAHMLYHVADRAAAAGELRRILRRGGVCIAVTNGANHLSGLRELVEQSVQVATPGWKWKSPSTHGFSLENGAEQLSSAFEEVLIVRPPTAGPVEITDPAVIDDYVGSIADLYQPETTKPWPDVVADVRRAVQEEINRSGAVRVVGDVGALVCR